MYRYCQKCNLSNHPDFVGILPILLEKPEFRPICNGDRKNPDFDICFDFSKWIIMIIKQEHIKEYT